MPRGDGTGPIGAGPGTGRGRGMGLGGRASGGRMGGFGLGVGGNCICPSCGRKVAHQRGVPCSQLKCPDCGSVMTRDF